MRIIVLPLITLLCAGCQSPSQPAPVIAAAPVDTATSTSSLPTSVGAVSTSAPAPSAPVGFSIPSLTGNVVADIQNLVTWLGKQSVADLTAARDIAANAVPPDLAGKNCHGWAAQEITALPALTGNQPFADIKGPISAFEKARVLLQNGLAGGAGSNGLLEQFNINCSPYIQSINYRAGKGALLIAGTATTGGAAAPSLGAVSELVKSLPSLFGP